MWVKHETQQAMPRQLENKLNIYIFDTHLGSEAIKE